MALTLPLYPYQEAAALLIWRTERVFLAYDMGSGKSAISLAAAEDAMDAGRAAGAVVVCLDPLKYQWAEQVAKFTDSACVVIDGTPAQRAKQLDQIGREKPRYVIVNYDWVKNNRKFYRRLCRDFVILDEATVIGKPRTTVTRACRRFAAQSRYRVALTGTGFDNNLPEFYSISEWVEKGRLGDWESFDWMFHVRDKFGRVTRHRNIDQLWTMTEGWLARKSVTDADVAPYMPRMEKMRAWAYLTEEQLALYDKIVLDLMSELDASSPGAISLASFYTSSSDVGEQRGRVMARIGALSMLCANPRLLNAAAERYVETQGKHGSSYAAELAARGLLLPADEVAPKLEAVIEYVRRILDDHPSNKVVVFSFWRDNIDYLDEALSRLTGTVQYHGGMSAKKKHEQRVRFRDPGVRVFVSSDAGGYGVDLPDANYLINVDPPWSAGKAAQRNSRIQRASSLWDVITVMDFIVRGSVDEWRWHVMNDKMRLQKAVLDRRVGSAGVLKPSTSALVKYLSQNSPTAR